MKSKVFIISLINHIQKGFKADVHPDIIQLYLFFLDALMDDVVKGAFEDSVAC